MVECAICLRCGSDEISYGYSCPPMRGVVECYADGCLALVTARSEAEAVAMWNDGRWNYRVTGTDDDGEPIFSAESN